MAKCIMVQGTMSGAGKSLIVTALCRLFKQDGFRVAPFKSQNMALNSFVTKNGLEMGRAQAVQAFAAGLEPDARMNPILLKPTSETGSQVILNGKIYGQYSATDYYNRKKELLPEVLRAYKSLASENDIIVIEGAGSPAEINLRKDDIVNMGLAELLDSKVLLVGNIDPGGVFAQLYGTVMLLSAKERERIVGFLINKFRGDPGLLTPGLEQMRELTGIPVLGVIPYTAVKLEEEDSLSGELWISSHKRPIDVCIVRLPYISNYTDFTPLQRAERIGIRYVSDAFSLNRPDLIILPGSKSTINDLRWLKETGLFQAIKALHHTGSDILGVCGGYQMLGKQLYDPETGEREEGFCFLPVDTEFLPHKITRQVRGRVISGPFYGAELKGYEIHTGRTVPDRMEENGRFTAFSELKREASERADEEDILDGCIADNVYGTYIHGLFDTGELIERMTDHYLEKRGLKGADPEKAGKSSLRGADSEKAGKSGLKGADPGIAEKSGRTADFRSYQEEQYDILAKVVREHTDMKKIYEELELDFYPYKRG